MRFNKPNGVRHFHRVAKVTPDPKPLTMKTIPVILLLSLLTCAGVYAQASKEIKHLETQAKAGDYNASRQLATAYATGVGVVEDHEAANHWYSVAAHQHEGHRWEGARVQEPSETYHPLFITPTTSTASHTVNESPFLSPSQTGSAVQVYSKEVSGDVKPTSPQPTPAISIWSKVTNAVSSASDKTQQYLSDHADEVEDLATFLIERYTGESETTEEPHGKSASGASSHPSK